MVQIGNIIKKGAVEKPVKSIFQTAPFLSAQTIMAFCTIAGFSAHNASPFLTDLMYIMGIYQRA